MTILDIKQRCLRALEYRETSPLSLDSPETTVKRWQIIREKPALRQIYHEWYSAIAASIPPGQKPVLELGSGAGFMSDYIDNLLTSDILELPQVDRIIDACGGLPFADGSLRGIAMVNTLHHLPDVNAFFHEAARCLEPGGAISMVEPWNTPWSRFVYGKFHHEPFDPGVGSWSFESSGPLSSANGALPWILFQRDRQRFDEAFQELEIRQLRPMMPIRYLLSGGVSMRPLVPSSAFGMLGALERRSRRLMNSIAMFAHITLTRR
jgi:SAM-dependent methyltransferase